MISERIGSAGLAAAVALLATACGAGAASTSPAAGPTSSMQISASASVPSVTPEGASPSTTLGASSQPAASPTATVESCPTYAATHTFLHLTAAKQNADGSLTVAGNHATMICGGPDDLHYDLASDTVTGHVTASASLQVLSFPGPKLVAITHARFASYLVADQNIRVFVVTGPLAAITALAEQYHP